jgi:carbon-monoxide dehydrogenase medium subunit
MTVSIFATPTSVDDVCALLEADPWGSKVISGGTAVALMLRQGLISPDSLVSIANIESLRGIAVADGVLRIGATMTLHEVSRSPEVRLHAPGVAAACAVVGNQRIRNVATIGGNLAEADYASDPPAALASYEARCRIVGPGGERFVPVIDLIVGFFETVLDTAEVITHVEIPISPHQQRGVYLKFRSRSSEDRACVGVAACVEVDRDRIVRLSVVVAAVASTLQSVESALSAVRGRPLDAQVAESVAEAFADAIDPMEDARGSAWYRSKMIKVFVRRAVEQVTGQQRDLGGRSS